MNLRHSVCVGILPLVLVVICPLPCGFAQHLSGTTVAKAGDKDEKAAKSKEREEYYELLRLFADTLDQVERNYRVAMGLRQKSLTANDACEWVRDL